MPAAVPWNPKVERRAQPPGELGVRSSLEEVGARISRGYVHPKVVVWARNQLARCRSETGQKMSTERERAECLLKAVQKKLWVPDPLAVEWMAEVHHLACDENTKDEVCILSMDCDECSALLASSFLAVGLNAAIVGHAYDQQRRIQHVLCLVRVSGKWMYADPSTQLPLGEVVKYTRERVLSVPNVKVICDEDVCFRDGREFDPDEHGFVDRGEFVGIDGVQSLGRPPVKFAWVHDVGTVAGHPTSERRQKFEWLGASTEQQAAAAAEKELAKKGSTDEEKAKAAASAAAGIAATAACAELGAGAIACGAVASAVTGYLVGAVTDLFSSSNCSPNCPAPIQFRAMVEYYTKLENLLLKPFTGKTVTEADTAKKLRAMGADDSKTVWADITNGPISDKYEAQILGQAATLKAQQQVRFFPTRPVQMRKKSKSSALPVVLGLGAIVGGGLWLAR